jgi:hypothetical protein
MKKIKLIDLAINLGLIGWFLIHKSWNDFDKLITAYFVVGSWQVISMIVHAYMKWFTKKGSARYIYHWLVFIAIITIPMGSFWVLAFTATPMALFYAILCIVEISSIRPRPLSLLK